MLDKNSWGQLLTISLYECSNDKLTDKDLLIDFCKLICKEIDMTPHWKILIERFWDWSIEWY